MKKIVTLFITLVLVLTLATSVAAASPAVSISGNATASAGSTITFTVSLSGCDNGTSLGVSIAYSDHFEFVSGEMLKTNGISKFDNSTEKGTFGSTSGACDLNGDIAKITLKALTQNANAQDVSITVVVKNGSTEICNKTATKSIKIQCASHSYGSWTKVDGNNHKRTCSACGNVETKAHSWDKGSVTKAASCKETGVKTYACTTAGCGATKTETIAKTTDHNWSDWKQTKAPTCSAKGAESRTCSKCQKVETKDVPMLSHQFSTPAVTKKPTCTEDGVESGKCSRCGKEDTNSIPATGHKITNYIVTKEATCTEKGVETGKCSTCGAEDTRDIKTKGHSYGDPVITKEPTDTEKGVQTKTCTACGNVVEEEISALDSSPSNPTDSPEDPGNDAPAVDDTDSDITIGDTTDTDSNTNKEPQGTVWLLLIAFGCGIVVGALVTFIVLKKKK